VTELERLAAAVLLPAFDRLRPPAWLLRRVEDGLGGVVLFGRNVSSPAQVAALTAGLRAARADLVVAIDEEGGDVTRLEAATGSSRPGNLALGAVDDADLTRDVAADIGRSLAAAGVSLNLAPCADVLTNPDNPVIGTRSFGGDPALVARHTAAYVAGLQGAGVAACAKHFPGHGGTIVDSHVGLPVVSGDPTTLRRVHLAPFRAAVHQGVRAVMTAHLVVPALDDAPATLSLRLLRGVLRDELGFTGAVVTDALEMAAIAEGVGVVEAAVRAIAAGADGLCLGGRPTPELLLDRVVGALVAAVGTGRLTAARLAEAGKRVRALGAVRRDVAGQAAPLDRIGLAAARRAVRSRGAVTLAAPPLVVDVATRTSAAVGRVPWGLGPAVARCLPGTVVARVAAGGTGAAPDPVVLAGQAVGRPLVVATRDARRHRAVQDLLAALVGARPDLVHVETGVPGPDVGAAGRIDTFGGAPVCMTAAAELLAGLGR
jgi:beta-N-acetylhexosaminidase